MKLTLSSDGHDIETVELGGHVYHWLEPRRGSNYRQLFLKNTRIRAETVFRETVGREPRPVDDVARDLGLPVEAVRECIHYCTHNEPLLRHERDRDTEGSDKLAPAPLSRQAS